MEKITNEMIREGIRKGIIRFIPDPNGRGETGTVCEIGENWFYFGGLEADQSTPEEYVRNTPESDLAQEVYDALAEFTEMDDEGMKDEYEYYALFLKENLTQRKEAREPVMLADLPVLGGLKVLDVDTKKVLHETSPEDPGDIAPDIAIRKVVAVYAAGDQMIVEVSA